MGTITDVVTHAIKEGIEAKGISVIVKPGKDNETISIEGRNENVNSKIEPDVEMMPGWIIYILDASVHIEAKTDPEDDRFEERVLDIPFADPKAIQKAVAGIDGLPLTNSSSHCGIIIMEVPDDAIDDESKWTFTIKEGFKVITHADGSQEMVPSDVFKPGMVIDPDKKVEKS